MTFLQGLHGVVAAVLLCSLLLVDESGVPLPIAPNEVLLLVAGVLISGGALGLWWFAPAALVTMAIGMLLGYGWARAVGQTGLRRLAGRVGAADVLDRLSARVRAAGPLQIGVLRVIPGVRPHATLVSGAAGVELRTFAAGAVPALFVWLAAWLAVGMLVGLPAEHLLGRFERYLLRGLLLGALALAVLHAYRRRPQDAQPALGRLPAPARAVVAVCLDAGVAASLALAPLAVVRRIAHTGARGWADVIAILLAGGAYAVITHRGRGTVGEVLTGTAYPPQRPPGPAGMRPVTGHGFGGIP